MHLPRKQKWILYVTFGFGIFVAVVDVVRISYLQNAAVARAAEVIGGQGSSNQRQTEQNSDFSWFAAYSFMWSAIEVNVGIMVACVPALKPLVSRFVPQLIRDKVGSRAEKQTSRTTKNNADTATAQRVASVEDAPSGSCQADEDAVDFITSPGMTETTQATERPQTAMTNTSSVSRQGTATNFDFVSMAESKSIVYMSNRESVRPIAEVTILFFLWGFAYGLLNALNGQIQSITKESANQAVGTHSAYYVGYFVAPLTFGRLILKSWGFKACYV